MRKLKGKQIFMEGLLAAGVRKLFGNPGTTEMPLMDSLTDYPEMEYYLALHEGVAVGMADAFALASGTPGVVNLHVAPGLGNGLGMVYNAWAGRSPLLVTAGQQDTRMRLHDPLLAHDLVAMAAPLVKLSVQAEHADELPLLMHRCLKTALEAPRGPVFLSLPLNVMEETTSAPVMERPHVFARTRPDPEAVEEAAAILLEARHPAIVCGEGVFRSRAQGALVAVAELLGAPVWNTVLPAAVNFPMTHSQYRGEMPGDAARVRQMLGPADAVLLVGGDFFKEIFHTTQSPSPEDAALIQIDVAPEPMARNLSVRIGMTADPKAALEALHDELLVSAPAGFHATVQARHEKLAGLKKQDRERLKTRLQKGWGKRPMSTARVMHELKGALPDGAVVVSEAITANTDLMRTLRLDRPGDYYGSRGGGIGQALPGALGFQLAHPDRRVVAVSGDGSSLYSIQALWTAAHHGLPVVFVILNNRTYRILKINMDRFRSDFGLGGERPYPHMDLTEPTLDYVHLAKGFGVPAKRIEDPDKLGTAIRAAFKSGGPYLLDVAVDGTWPVR